MASINDLFKKPSLPGSNKRKAEIVKRDPNEIYKSIKLNGHGDARSNGEATVQDEPEDDEGYAGPQMPPDLEDENIDDEEGRFFGGGLTSNTADVLDFIDQQDQDGSVKLEKIDSAWPRRLALNFEKKISKNAELRAKFEGDPEKFMGSEADLDADIKALSILSEHSNFYQEFAQLGCVSSLVSLLAHENTDIAIDAIEIISELTDEDVEAEQSQWDALVDAMLDADLLDLLSQNMTRFNEDLESDRTGVYHVLGWNNPSVVSTNMSHDCVGVLENLSSRPALADRIGTNVAILQWLVSRAGKKEAKVTQNKQYAIEVLAILLQSSISNRKQFISFDGIDTFLQLLSAYRKRDPPKGSEEEEWVENIFDCVTCCMDEEEGKQKLLDAEGIELSLIMLKEGKMSKPRALRLLNHALGGVSGGTSCEKLVDAAGLKVLFTMFMKKHDNITSEHLLGIFASMFRLLPGDSASRIRLLGKFVEKDYEKIQKLVTLRRAHASRVAAIDNEIKSEQNELSPAEREDHMGGWLSRRLDAGLFSLQTIDVILAWLIAEDDGVKSKAQDLLAERDESFGDIRGTIQEQLDSLQNQPEDEDSTFKDMLSILVQFV
ncbi:hypothetical protein MMC14_008831 [Varicellaria rhodocarpa]|nr:hypothetical protein [Varicellaria rhodocarpa]